MNNLKTLNIAHINVRSLRHKVDEIKLLLRTHKYDILAITETWLDSTVPSNPLNINNYRLIRRDRPRGSGGGCAFYIADHINVQHQKSLDSANIEAIWIKVKTSTSMILMGVVYRSPRDKDFFDNFAQPLEQIWLKHQNIVLLGDLNCDLCHTNIGDSIDKGTKLLNLLNQFSLHVDNKNPTRITQNSATLLDLVISNKRGLIKSTGCIQHGISDHHLIHASVNLKIRRPPPRIITARTFKNFDQEDFKKDVQDAPWSVCDAFDDLDDTCWAWTKIFNDICDGHAPYRSFKVRSQSLPWITPQIRHKMNQRYKLYRNAIKSNDAVVWKKYKDLRNQLTTEVRKAKANYYKQQFDVVKDVKSYWKLVKEAPSSSRSTSIKALRREDNTLATNDHEKATILNQHFSSVGEKLAQDLPLSSFERNPSIPTPTISTIKPSITVTTEAIEKQISRLKSDKAHGPDNISPRMLKFANEAIVPPLTAICFKSATRSTLPKSWKTAKITPIFKKDKEDEKSNYRPISLLCIPSKVMEACVADALTEHMLSNDLFSPFQWAYRKGLSSELLLLNIVEQWRSALDSNSVICAVFFDFKKAFDSIDHTILLNKIAKLGVSDDVRLWITDYLTDRTQYTVVQGASSNIQKVTYGVPQEYVLGPLLFSIFCNDLPDIGSQDDKVYMYADDTTIFTVASNKDTAVNRMNIVLQRLFLWCLENKMTAHPGKCECMILQRSTSIGPTCPVKFGQSIIKQVQHTRCLGVELDDKLSWSPHITELSKSFVKKINILKCLYFLPKLVRQDFYFKVILPSVTYAILIWGTCNKTLMESLNKIHYRAARIIHRLPYNTTRTQVTRELHWKCLTHFFNIKLGLLAHKGIHKDIHQDLTHLFKQHNVERYELRGTNKLQVPMCKTVSFGTKSIKFQASKLWNSLPNETRQISSEAGFKFQLRKDLN